MDNKIKAVLSMLGGIVGYLFGGLDSLLEVFCLFENKEEKYYERSNFKRG